MNSVLRIAIRFVILLFIQIVILNHIDLHGYVKPMIYPLFILLLPFKTPAWISLGLAFVMGMIIDGFTGTLGFHTAALVLTAFMRPLIMMIVQPRGGYEDDMQPFVSVMGINWFVFCSIALLLLHHSAYFFIEAFSFDFFLSTLVTIIISTILSLILFLTYQFFIIRSK